MRDLSDVILKPNDFGALQALCQADPRFPNDMPAWDALIDLATAQARASGLYPLPLRIQPGAFEEWCQRGAVLPSMDSLRAYAIVRRGQVTHDGVAGRAKIE